MIEKPLCIVGKCKYRGVENSRYISFLGVPLACFVVLVAT